MIRLYVGIFAVAIFQSGCAYKLGGGERSLPGGYKQVHVPVFKNTTLEPGVEVFFTNAMVREIEMSKVGRVTGPNLAEVVLVGTVSNVGVTPVGAVKPEVLPSLPTGTVIAASYQILVEATVQLKRASDGVVLWEGTFRGERAAESAKMTMAGINTVNSLYNLSARRKTIETLATTMMNEAHDRLTESY